MSKIVVSAELARLLGRTFETAELVDEAGNHLGYFNPPVSKEEIEEAKRRLAAGTEGRTTAEVLERLASSEVK